MERSDFDLIHNVNAGKHFYQFYKSQDDYLQIMAKFFRAGLEKGEACIWLVSDKIGVPQAKLFADTMIPRFLYYFSSNQFVIRSAQEWYLTNEKFDEEKSLRNASEFVEGAIKKGYHRIRGSGDAASVPREEWPKLEAYEHKVDTVIQAAPVLAVCAYPILDCTLKETKMVLECHDDVLVGHL